MGSSSERDFAGFRIVRPLELGERASVWEAEDAETGELVAIETLAGEAARDADVCEWFAEAWELVAELDDPGIVAVKRIGDDDGVPFAVRTPAGGTPLARRIAIHGAFDTAATVSIIAQLGNALERAHDAGVIHGALGADCVILQGSDPTEPRAQLSGFGRAEGDRREDIRDLGAVLAAMLPAGGSEGDDEEGEGTAAPVAALREVAETASADGYDTAAELVSAAQGAVGGKRRREASERSGGGRRGVIALAAIAAAAVVVVLLISGGGDDGNGSDPGTSTSAQSTTSTTTDSSEPTTTTAPPSTEPPAPIGVRGFPVGVVARDGAVYTVTRDGASLRGFDEASGEQILGPIDLPGAGGDVTIVDGVAWASLPDDDAIARVDLSADPPVAESIGVGSNPTSLIGAVGSIWIVDEGSAELTRVPLEQSDEARRESVPLKLDQPRGIAFGLGALWVSDASGQVVRVDPEDPSKQVAFKVDGDPGSLLVVDDRIWVVNPGDGTVTVFDPASRDSETIDVGGEPRDLAADSRRLWVANADGYVTSIDLRSDATEQIDVSGAGGSPQAIAVGQQVWATTGGGNRLIAVAPAG